MKKQTLLLIGLGVVLIAMAKKKPKPTSTSRVIINDLKSSNSGGFKNGFPVNDVSNLLTSLFNRNPTKNEASQIVNNWKGFNPFN